LTVPPSQRGRVVITGLTRNAPTEAEKNNRKLCNKIVINDEITVKKKQKNIAIREYLCYNVDIKTMGDA